MIGLDRRQGAAVGGIDHLRQSIVDILTTRIGTRVLRRDYGSELPALVDRPFNRALAVDLVAATAEALHRWEPRLSLTSVRVVAAAPGRVELTLDGVYLPDGQPLTLEGIIVP